MSSKIRPDDWDRLFAPNAPRRGGPLYVFGILIMVLVLFGILAVTGIVFTRNRDVQIARANATRTAFTLNVAPGLTATALAAAAANEQATAAAIANATAAALPTPTAASLIPADAIGVGTVINGGNLRSEARIADDTLRGLIWPGDQIAFIDQTEVNGQLWYLIVITDIAPDRGGEGVPAGEIGWASATLLSEPAPVP